MLLSLKRLNQELKSYDSCLYAQETRPGRYDVYRQNRSMCSPAHFVFALTEDWSPNTRPVPWGLDVILNRLRAHDLWNHGDGFVDRWIEDHAKHEAGQARDFKNNVESFLYDFRSQFHKATSSINTAGLGKTPTPGL